MMMVVGNDPVQLCFFSQIRRRRRLRKTTVHSQSNSYIGLDRNNTAGYLGEEEYEEYEDECSIFDVWIMAVHNPVDGNRPERSPSRLCHQRRPSPAASVYVL